MLQLTDYDITVKVLTEEHIKEHTQLRNKLLGEMQGGWWVRSMHFPEDKEESVLNCPVNIYGMLLNVILRYFSHGIFHCFTVHFDSLSFIHTNSCTFSYNHVSVF